MTYRSALFTFALALLTACSSPQKPAVHVDPNGNVVGSGFLSDYSQLLPSRDREGAFVYTNPDKPLRLYKMVMIDPVEVRLSDRSTTTMDKAQLDRIARTFEREIRSALGNSYPVVNHPGFGVLRIRAAITDVTPAQPGLNAIPVVRLAGIGFGGARIEAELLDTQSNAQVVAFMDSAQGKSYRVSTGLTETGHAEDTLRDWARLLRITLDGSRDLRPLSDVRTSGDRWR